MNLSELLTSLPYLRGPFFGESVKICLSKRMKETQKTYATVIHYRVYVKSRISVLFQAVAIQYIPPIQTIILLTLVIVCTLQMVVLSIKFLFFLPSSSSTNCVALWNCQQKVMLVLGGVHSIFTFARAFSFAYGGLRAAHQMHDVLLQKVMSAPITFFERNPRGRILNR